MTGDERLLADLHRDLMADLHTTYLDSLAAVTVFVEAEGEPTPEQLMPVLGHYEPRMMMALTASCWLSWQILTGLAAAVNVPPAQFWAYILQRRASAPAGTNLELFPFPPGWPT